MTSARRFNDKVPLDEKRERLKYLQKTQNNYSREKNISMLDRVCEVLVEGMSKKDVRYMTGKTRTNATVNFAGGDDLRGRLVSVRIREAHLHSLSGERV